ncbi:DsbE family thiol:disulfide interchange protein [Acidocella aromatica]|uniref:Cytochrome c biogenesis protein CcmG/thiol:disulfide interchange protein DsbE n=1 Tax=Acidocella aromatica TaxID=1303579 RepID=A0A840VA27_9PROT|nr:DsbE family thiol:disulfide interchange protein [Acidocella aromatica]MBB5372404.1 cytochrome c biogenesis protein CcmG/thiol:disulfide interchange protein DsbE [Acidocella aromatica]
MSPWRRRLLFGIPLALAAAGGEAFYVILRRMQSNDYDPHALPSQLIGKRPPAFSLSGAGGMQGFANTDLAAPPKPMLVNWFASWCVPCREEAPMLAKLAASGLTIWGIAYEDDAQALAQFLTQNGNPYQRLAADADGTTAINWGVYGVPETYFIDKAGIVRWRYAGALTDEVVATQLNPLLAKYS